MSKCNALVCRKDSSTGPMFTHLRSVHNIDLKNGNGKKISTQVQKKKLQKNSTMHIGRQMMSLQLSGEECESQHSDHPERESDAPSGDDMDDDESEKSVGSHSEHDEIDEAESAAPSGGDPHDEDMDDRDDVVVNDPSIPSLSVIGRFFHRLRSPLSSRVEILSLSYSRTIEDLVTPGRVVLSDVTLGFFKC